MELKICSPGFNILGSITLLWILQCQFFSASAAPTTTTNGTLEGRRTRVDQTLQENATGFEIVQSILHKIHRSQIFPEDYDFLRRVAMIESGYGIDLVETNNFTGGIWRVDKDKYELTKTKLVSLQAFKLSEARSKIRDQFSINWMNTKWDDLRKPFYSALAFRLFFHFIQFQKHPENETRSEPDAFAIPETLEEQALHWANYYHNYTNKLSEQDFIYILEDLENKVGTCGGRMDLVVLLDGSGSIEREDYETAKKFVADLFMTYAHKTRKLVGEEATESNMDNPIRLGFVVFSSMPYAMFTLTHKMSPDQLKNVVMSTKHPGHGSNISSGIIEAVKLFVDPHLSYSETDRVGVPKVLIVITDRLPNKDGWADSSSAINLAKASNITTFAIGIGQRLKTDQSELLQIAYNRPSNVFILTDYKTLGEFYRKLNSITCIVPQTPARITTGNNKTITITTDTLFKKETRLYSFPLPDNDEGLTVFLTSQQGQIKGFYSYGTDAIPSSVLHDGELTEDIRGTFIPSLNLKANNIKTLGGNIKHESSQHSNSKIVQGDPEIRTRLYLWSDTENGNASYDNHIAQNQNSYNYNNSKTNEGVNRVNVLIAIQGLSAFNNYTIQTISGFAQPFSGYNGVSCTFVYSKIILLINLTAWQFLQFLIF